MIAPWAQAYIGIPHISQDPNGIDCWALMSRILDEQFGLKVALDDKWQPINDPQVGDVYHYHINTSVDHVGVYVGDQRIIHSSIHMRSMIERTRCPLFVHRLAGIYRRLP